MPIHESQPVKVTLTVEVDGHVLTFAETGKATGGRYHGAAPTADGYSTDHTLESSIQSTVDECATNAGYRARLFLARAYPMVGNRVDR